MIEDWTLQEIGYLRDLAVLEVLTGQITRDVIERFEGMFGEGTRTHEDIEKAMADVRRDLASEVGEAEKALAELKPEHRRFTRRQLYDFAEEVEQRVREHVSECGMEGGYIALNGLVDGAWEEGSSDEHQRLADAAKKLIERIDPDYTGDLPAAVEAMAEGVHEGVQGMYYRLRRLSR